MRPSLSPDKSRTTASKAIHHEREARMPLASFISSWSAKIAAINAESSVGNSLSIAVCILSSTAVLLVGIVVFGGEDIRM